jgi:uncharacterized protein (UPF0335 family)
MSQVNHNIKGLVLSAIERLNKLDDEIANLRSDQKDIRTELKSAGIDMKAFSEVLKLSRMSPVERQERMFLTTAYAELIGIKEGE